MYSIIDNQADFMVVSKHHGSGIHTEGDELGVIAQIKKDCQLSALFPVHRLDKVTSGLLLCAKKQSAASELSQLFQRRQVEKYYVAISDKKPKRKQGLVSGDMEKSRRGSWKLCHTKANPAVTQFFSAALGNGQRLFLLKPSTGKTHQLRVALKSIGSSILGDRLYGHPVERDQGICLHAYVLGFEYQGQHYRYQQAPSHWTDIDWSDLALKANPANVSNRLDDAPEEADEKAEQTMIEQALVSVAFDEPWALRWPPAPLSVANGSH